MEPGTDAQVFLKAHELPGWSDESSKPCWLGISNKGLNQKGSDTRELFDNSHESLIEKHENSRQT